jgi:hypothetical protein
VGDVRRSAGPRGVVGCGGSPFKLRSHREGKPGRPGAVNVGLRAGKLRLSGHRRLRLAVLSRSLSSWSAAGPGTVIGKKLVVRVGQARRSSADSESEGSPTESVLCVNPSTM